MFANHDLVPFKLFTAAFRATSAATGFFEPIIIEYGNHYKDTFRDGATGCNNPVEETYDSAYQIWPNDELCMVSLGTGVPTKSQWKDESLPNDIRAVIKISTQTERSAEKFARSHPNVPYYRFNIPGLGDIRLQEHTRADEILGGTESYLRLIEQEEKLRECVKMLRGDEFENRTFKIIRSGTLPRLIYAYS
jgi:hypothetical protein